MTDECDKSLSHSAESRQFEVEMEVGKCEKRKRNTYAVPGAVRNMSTPHTQRNVCIKAKRLLSHSHVCWLVVAHRRSKTALHDVVTSFRLRLFFLYDKLGTPTYYLFFRKESMAACPVAWNGSTVRACRIMHAGFVGSQAAFFTLSIAT